MKKKILLIVLCGLVLLYFQFGRKPEINTATTNSTPEGYQLNVTVTANTLFIINKERAAQKFIDKTLANDFQKIQLPYEEYGYPNELHLTVYANAFGRRLSLPAFRVEFKTRENPLTIMANGLLFLLVI